MLLQQQLIKELELIPEHKLAEIYDLIHYSRLDLAQENPKTEQKRPKFGFARALSKCADDFDEPLEDFKDSMP